MKTLRRLVAERPELFVSAEGEIVCSAIKGHQMGCYRFLEAQGADTSETDRWLSAAISYDWPELVESLLSRNVAVSGWPDPRTDPMHDAAHHAGEGVVMALLEHGANPFVLTEPTRFYPLHTAAYYSNPGAAKALLSVVRSPDDTAAQHGQTPLHVVGRGSAPNGWPPPHVHTRRVVHLLLARSADIEAGDDCGFTPLQVAALDDREVVTDALLRAGAHLESRDLQGCTPLFTAAAVSSLKSLKILVRAGADVNARDIHGEFSTPLIRGVASFEITDVLLRAGASVNEADSTGRTALHAAAAGNWLQSLGLLLACGADRGARTVDGLTPFDYALSSGHREIAEYLKHTG